MGERFSSDRQGQRHDKAGPGAGGAAVVPGGGGPRRPGVQRVVIWVAQGAQAPAELLAALAKRRVVHVVVESGLMAVAQACVAAKATTADTEAAGAQAAGLPTPGLPTPSALVILVDAPRLAGASRACAAIGRYVAQARCWCYSAGLAQSLRPVTDQDLVNWGAVEVSASEAVEAFAAMQSKAQAAGTPRPAGGLTGVRPGSLLRLTPGTGPAPSNPAHGDADDSHLLTPQELRMLLGHDAPSDPDASQSH
jgi:hypothetical protein